MSNLTSLAGAPLTGAPHQKSGGPASATPSSRGFALPAAPSLLPKPGVKSTVVTGNLGAIDSLFHGASVKTKVGDKTKVVPSKPSPQKQKPLAQCSEKQHAGFGDFPVSRGLLKNPIGQRKPRSMPRNIPELESNISAKKMPQISIAESEDSSYGSDSFGSESAPSKPAGYSPTDGGPAKKNPAVQKINELQEREKDPGEFDQLEEEEDPSVARLLSYFQDNDQDSKDEGKSVSAKTGQTLKLDIFGPGATRPSSSGMGRRVQRNVQASAWSDSELQEGFGRSAGSKTSIHVLEAEDIEDGSFNTNVNRSQDRALDKPSDRNTTGEKRLGRPTTPDISKHHRELDGLKEKSQKPFLWKADDKSRAKTDELDFDWELELGLSPPKGHNEQSQLTNESPQHMPEGDNVAEKTGEFVVVNDNMEIPSISDTQSGDGDSEVGGYVPSFLSPQSTAFSPSRREVKSMLNHPQGSNSSHVIPTGAPRPRSIMVDSKESAQREENKNGIEEDQGTMKTETHLKTCQDRNQLPKLPLMEGKAREIAEVQRVILAAKGRREALLEHMQEKGLSQSNQTHRVQPGALGKMKSLPKLVEAAVETDQELPNPKEGLVKSSAIYNEDHVAKQQRNSKYSPGGAGFSTSIPQLSSSYGRIAASAIGGTIPTMPSQKPAQEMTGAKLAGHGNKKWEGFTKKSEVGLQDYVDANECVPKEEHAPKRREERKSSAGDIHFSTDASAPTVSRDWETEEEYSRNACCRKSDLERVTVADNRDMRKLEASLLVTAQNTWKEIEALASSAVAREKEVSNFLSGELPEREKKLSIREKLVIDREAALEKREKSLDALKCQIMEVLEKLDKAAGQDRDELQGERTRLAKEHSRLDAFYKALEDDRADVRQQLELEMKLVESAREERRQERKTMLEELHAERVRLAQERAEALNSLRVLQQEEMDTRKRISELDALAAMAHKAADEEENRLTLIKSDLETRKQTIESSRAEMQREAEMLSAESEQVSKALGFVDGKMQELRDLTQDVPNMMMELSEAQKILQEEWMQCAAQQESLEKERRALAIEKESVERQRGDLELRHQQACLEREALDAAAAEAKQARQKLSQTVQLMSSEGLTTEVNWDSSKCKLRLKGDQASSPQDKSATAVNGEFGVVKEDLDHVLSGIGNRNYGCCHQTKQMRRTRGGNRGHNSLRKMLGYAGVDLKQLEEEAKKSTVLLSSQVAFLQQAQAASGFQHKQSVDISACGLAPTHSVHFRGIHHNGNFFTPTLTEHAIKPIVIPSQSEVADQPSTAAKASLNSGAEALAPPDFTPLLNGGSTTDSFDDAEAEFCEGRRK